MPGTGTGECCLACVRCCGCTRRSRREFEFGLGGGPPARGQKGPGGVVLGSWPDAEKAYKEKGAK